MRRASPPTHRTSCFCLHTVTSASPPEKSYYCYYHTGSQGQLCPDSAYRLSLVPQSPGLQLSIPQPHDPKEPVRPNRESKILSLGACFAHSTGWEMRTLGSCKNQLTLDLGFLTCTVARMVTREPWTLSMDWLTQHCPYDNH